MTKKSKSLNHPSESPFPKVSYTLDDAIRAMGFGAWHDGRRVNYEMFSWPPDVFAMAATILRESGAYLQASRPLGDKFEKRFKKSWMHPAWCTRILDSAKLWRCMEPPISAHLARTTLERFQREATIAGKKSNASITASEMAKVQEQVNNTTAQFANWDACANMPPRVLELLEELFDRRSMHLYLLSQPAGSDPGWMLLLELMCIADEASRGVGLIFELKELVPSASPASNKASSNPWDGYPADSWVARASVILFQEQAFARDLPIGKGQGVARKRRPAGAADRVDFQPVTLCWRVDPTRAVVLPKMRTSQRGVTIRSFSLHLCLLNGSDVEAVWNPPSRALLKSSIRSKPDGRAATTGLFGPPSDVVRHAGPYNVVLLPWPHEIRPSQFAPAQRDGPDPALDGLDQRYDCLGQRPIESDRFFTFVHDPCPADLKHKIKDLLTDAERQIGPIHGLVLPEMAMTRQQFDEVFGRALPEQLDFLACGVYEPAKEVGALGKNYVIVRQRHDVPELGYIEFVQQKHHRWALDSNQLAQYSLGSSLRGKATWWEAIDLPRRTLHFVAIDAFVAFTVLVCEDLARPDPVADAVRAVGPNLVICLLLDGPQLKERWSARYATVLADDPGSSVLTLSSLGMVNLSRMRDKLHERSRVIALWRESGGVPIELHLPDGTHGLAISLTAEDLVERTLDGRADAGTGTVIRLAGVHPVSWRKP